MYGQLRLKGWSRKAFTRTRSSRTAVTCFSRCRSSPWLHQVIDRTGRDAFIYTSWTTAVSVFRKGGGPTRRLFDASSCNNHDHLHFVRRSFDQLVMICVIPRTGEGSSAQDICEANGAVDERANGEHRAFGYAVAIACSLEMLRYGFGTDAESLGDFPIGLTPCDQRDAIDLTIGGSRRGRDAAIVARAILSIRPLRSSTTRPVNKCGRRAKRMGAGRYPNSCALDCSTIRAIVSTIIIAVRSANPSMS